MYHFRHMSLSIAYVTNFPHRLQHLQLTLNVADALAFGFLLLVIHYVHTVAAQLLNEGVSDKSTFSKVAVLRYGT